MSDYFLDDKIDEKAAVFYLEEALDRFKRPSSYSKDKYLSVYWRLAKIIVGFLDQKMSDESSPGRAADMRACWGVFLTGDEQITLRTALECWLDSNPVGAAELVKDAIALHERVQSLVIK